jgi:uncharacterized protein YlxW (UPF0749 family)
MKLNQKLVIGVVCVILGIIIAMQYKIVQSSYLNGMAPTQRSVQLISEYNKMKDEREKLQKQITELEEKLSEIENSASKENAVIKGMKDDLNKFKKIAGFTALIGPGIEVVVDNPTAEVNYSNEINIINDYELILALVNDLNAAGAEAIEVNGQRLISTSEIRNAGESISINTVYVNAPIIVHAIGNPAVLDGAINQRFGIVTRLRDSYYQVYVKTKDQVEIPKYNEVLQFNYASPVED